MSWNTSFMERKRTGNNLSGAAARLVAFREGLNLVHILSDAGKRQEARSLALTIVGGTGILPLVSVVAFFIMAVWALGEALLDVRCLLGGEKEYRSLRPVPTGNWIWPDFWRWEEAEV